MVSIDLGVYLNCVHSSVIEDAWKDPSHRQPDGFTDLDYWQSMAQLMERGKMAMMFFADGYAIYDTYEGSIRPTIRRGSQVPEHDPLPLLTGIASATEHIGLASTASTSYYPPYLLAKKLSTIDHLTDGRLGWNVVMSGAEAGFRNVLGRSPLPHDERYDRGDEFMEVVYQLWEESWADDAIVRDTETGTYADPEKVTPIEHSGEYFDVPGAHICSPSPQRTPLLIQAGQSERGRAFGARHGELLFTFKLSPEKCQSFVEDVTERAVANGRDPEDLNVWPGVSIYVAPTDEAAQRKYERAIDLIDPETGLIRMSGQFNHDYSQYDLDSPLEDLPVEGSRGSLKAFIEDDREWTIRDAGIQYARYPVPEFVGSPETVADELERWAEHGADGFIVLPARMPSSVEDIVEHLVPELQRRGIYRESYGEGETFRERLFDHKGRRLPDRHESRSAST